MIKCPHCDTSIFQANGRGDRLKVRTRILVLHKSGEAEINCPNCHQPVTVGKMDEIRLKKAFPHPKFIIKAKGVNQKA